MAIFRTVLTSGTWAAFGKVVCYDGITIWQSQSLALPTRHGTRSFPVAWKVRDSVRWIIALLLFALAAIAVIALAPSSIPPLSNLSVLAEAAGSLRPSPGRLTGGFSYAPFQNKQPRLKPSRELIETGLRVSSAAQRNQTAGALAEAGRLNLIEGRLDLAHDLFIRAGDLEPANAFLQNDLAAIFLAQGHAQDSPLLYLRALAAAERAVELDGMLLEARFTRAIALELLGISWEAKRAWKSYLELDGASEWADEARRHLLPLIRSPNSESWEGEKGKLQKAALQGDQGLMNALISRFPFQARIYGESLLCEWAQLQQQGDLEGAKRTLMVARELGRASAQLARDFMLQHAVDRIDRESAAGIGHERGLVEGLLAYREGLAALDERDYPRAVPLLFSARRQLLKADLPLAFWATVHLATGLFHENNYSEARELLQEVCRRTESNLYPNLHGRALWILGLIETARARYDRAYLRYMKALEMYERSGELESAASVHALVFDNFNFIGDQEESLRHLHKALQLYPRIPLNKRSTVLWCGSLAASREGRAEIARYFQDEAVRLAQKEGDAVAVISALRSRSVTLLEMGEKKLALHDLAEAKEYLQEIPAAQTRDAMLGLILLTESELQVGRDPHLALEAAEEALSLAERTGDRPNLPKALLARARAFVALSDPVRAADGFAATFKEIDRQRDDLLSPSSRERFFTDARPIFDESVAFYSFVLRRPDLAYGFVEHAQARLLLDTVEGRNTGLPRLEEISRRLPNGVVLLQFSVLAERTLLWAISRDGFRFESMEVGERLLELKVEAFRSAILKDDVDIITDLGRILYSQLMGRMLARLPMAVKIVLIPDKARHHLPFAALKNPQSGKYLVEERTLEIAPSARIYLRSLDATDKRPAGPPSLLFVAGPDLNLSLLPHLTPLSFSEEEAAAIQALFGGTTVLTGSAATKRALLAEASRHSLLHLATHAVTNESDPMYSYLALSPDNDAGLLYAHELYEADLHELNLVFLAGCETATGPISKSEGVISLARPFLVAGAQEVIGSYWEVGDRASATFAAAFYEKLAKGLPASAALCATQRELIARKDAPSVSAWGGFVLIGTNRSVVRLAGKHSGPK